MDELCGMWVTMSLRTGPRQESATSQGELGLSVRAVQQGGGHLTAWSRAGVACVVLRSFHIAPFLALRDVMSRGSPRSDASPACEKQDLLLEAARSVGEPVEITFACSQR